MGREGDSSGAGRLPEVVREANRGGLLAVHELFGSIQGETSFAGRPCVFVRLTGCPLRCRWCDTTYAYEDGELRSIDEVVREVLAYRIPLVSVTGGEPLAQNACGELLARLADAGRTVLLETSGAFGIGGVDPRVIRIVDGKAPSSGESARNRWANVELLRAIDEVKLVLASRADYEWARDIIRRHDLPRRCSVLLGPVRDRLSPAELAAWILEDGLDVRLHLQIHTLIWPPGTRGV